MSKYKYYSNIPKNALSKRKVERREPKIIENVKKAMLIKGSSCNQSMSDLLTDIHLIKAPYSVKFTKKKSNNFHPFTDISPIEFMSQKNDCSLFCFASHNKKRPNNLVFGRMFNFHILDMFEMGVTNYKPISSFPTKYQPGKGRKPLFVFCGDQFESDERFKNYSNLLLDFFRGKVTDLVNLEALEHVIICTALENTIFFRHYAIVLNKSSSKLPRVELEEIGPSFDLSIRRTQLAPSDLMKNALIQPRAVKPKKKKNIKTNVWGETEGVVHKETQDLASMSLRRFKAMKRKSKRKLEEAKKQSRKKQTKEDDSMA